MRCAPDILCELLDSQFVNVVESYSVTFSIIPTRFSVRFSTEDKVVTKGEGTFKPQTMLKFSTGLCEKETV